MSLRDLCIQNPPAFAGIESRVRITRGSAAVCRLRIVRETNHGEFPGCGMASYDCLAEPIDRIDLRQSPVVGIRTPAHLRFRPA